MRWADDNWKLLMNCNVKGFFLNAVFCCSRTTCVILVGLDSIHSKNSQSRESIVSFSLFILASLSPRSVGLPCRFHYSFLSHRWPAPASAARCKIRNDCPPTYQREANPSCAEDGAYQETPWDSKYKTHSGSGMNCKVREMECFASRA